MSNTGPLREVLRAAVVEHDLTTDKIAKNAKGLRGRSWLQEKQTELWREQLLTDDELTALSAGYRVPKERLRQADLDGHGLEIKNSGDRRAWLFEEDAAGLTERQRDAVRFLIVAMRENSDGWGAATVVTLEPPDQRVVGGQRAARGGTNRGKQRRAELDRQAETPHRDFGDEPS